MASLNADYLARAAGLDESVIGRLVEAGVLPVSEAGGFEPLDIAKARLIAGLIEAGLSLADLAAAMEEGRLSLDYVELLMPEPVRLLPDSSSSAGLESAHVDEIQSILGTDRAEGDPIREDDLALLEVMARAVELGASPERILRIVRSTAQVVRHIVDLQRDFVDEVLLAPATERLGSPTAALAETASVRMEFRHLGRQLIAILLERFVDDAVFTNLVQLTELVLAEGDVVRPQKEQSMVFVDISGYTKKSEEMGDDAAAEQATLLADFVQELADTYDGRMVRSLGDGAMVHFPSATSAVAFALTAVRTAERQGLWTLHAGVNTGPMLRRDGDYFGAAVNIASRVADQAGPGEVKVSQAVVDAWAGGTTVTFESIGEAALKNVADPVPLFIADFAPISP
jgi:class 3 adenylate cyclase